MAEGGEVEGKVGAHIIAKMVEPFAHRAEEVGEHAAADTAKSAVKHDAERSVGKAVDPYSRLGPDVVDHTKPGGDLIPDDYDRFRGSEGPDGFIKDHWNPDKVNDWDPARSTGDWNYPGDAGFTGPTIKDYDPPVGTKMDRYGGTGGDFTAEPGTSFEKRSLPPDSLGKDYHQYELKKPFDGESGYPRYGETAPAFGQDGGGMQYKLPKDVGWLLRNGYLKEVRP